MISQNDLINLIATNKLESELFATGDRKRFDSNKLLFDNEPKFINLEELLQESFPSLNNTVLIYCGKPHPAVKKSLSAKFKLVELTAIINHKASIFWNNRKEYIGVDLNHYCSNPEILKYSTRKNKSDDTLEASIQKHFNNRKDLVCLSLGCGCGRIERNIFPLKQFARIDACDISPESIEQAKTQIKEIDPDGIVNYFVADINHDELKESEYDFIFANSCMHHIENLEFAYENIAKALKPNGLFYQGEYVGKNRFQNSQRIVSLVNNILKILPEKWKIKNNFENFDLKRMINNDPSEAIRSEEIVPLTHKYFDVIYKKYSLGSLMHIIYRCINTDLFHCDGKHLCSNSLRTKFFCKLIYNIEKIIYRECDREIVRIIARKRNKKL